MMNDSVREEMEARISSKPATGDLKSKAPAVNKLIQPHAPKLTNNVVNKMTANKTVGKNQFGGRTETAHIQIKQTSQMLVEFQSKEPALPEWRLQLQNAVRQRKEQNQPTETEVSTNAAPSIVHRSKGATALKAEVLEMENPDTDLHENAVVANALRRIEASRKKFYVEEKPQPAAPAAAPKKDYPFYIASKSDETTVAKNSAKSSTNFSTAAKPKLVSSLREGKADFDTNKLPPLPQAVKMSTSFESRPAETLEKAETEIIETKIEEKAEEKHAISAPEIKSEIVKEAAVEETTEIEEAEDYAPLAVRFNAGVFDVLIGSFASLILLSPFMLFGGEWFTLAGLFAFLATTAIVMFVYMTTAVGLFGKTFGMKLFSLELIDIEENDYPTFHQAAVSSSVYLLSLALGGTGFLTVPFTTDGRAVHDIVSGTIIVREYE
jgi:uncharacterized RDD family membrane protein YckC